MTIIFKQRGTGSYFLGYIKHRLERNKNFLLAITGPTGSGKTYSGLRIGELLDKDFTIDRVVFTSREFMRVINGGTLRRGSVILYDEAGVGLSARQWQSVQNKLINFVMQTFRHRNLIVIFTSPDLSFMDASSRKLLHCYAETVGIDSERKVVKLKPLLLQTNQRSGDVYYKYLRVILPGRGVVPIKRFAVSLPSIQLVRDYEEKKRNFTQELNESIMQDLEDAESFKGRDLTPRQEDLIRLLNEGKLVPDIAGIFNIDLRMVRMHMVAIRRKGWDIRPMKEGARIIRYEVTRKSSTETKGIANAHTPLTELGDPPNPKQKRVKPGLGTSI